MARVFAGDGVCEIKQVKGSQADICQITDGRGDDIERALRIRLPARDQLGNGERFGVC